MCSCSLESSNSNMLWLISFITCMIYVSWKHTAVKFQKFSFEKLTMSTKKTLFNFQLLLVWRVKNIHGWSYIGFGLGMTMNVVTKQVLNIGWLENKFCVFFSLFFYTQTFIYSIQMGRTNQYSATCARHRFFTNNKFNKIFARLCTRIGACSTVYHISHIF